MTLCWISRRNSRTVFWLHLLIALVACHPDQHRHAQPHAHCHGGPACGKQDIWAKLRVRLVFASCAVWVRGEGARPLPSLERGTTKSEPGESASLNSLALARAEVIISNAHVCTGRLAQCEAMFAR